MLLLISFRNLTDSTPFESVNFTVNAGERIGLVGPNGCGKTTLLRIIAGQEKANSGVVMHAQSDLRTATWRGPIFWPGGHARQFHRSDEGDLSALSDRLEALALAC